MTSTEQLYAIVRRTWSALNHRTGWVAHLNAEDAIQEAVLRCWSYRDRHDAMLASANTFFSMIARQSFSMQVQPTKTLRRGEGIRPQSLDYELGDGFSYLSTLEDQTPGPAERAELADDIRALRAAIGRLPAGLRVVMEDQLAGVSQTDTAKRLGVTRQRVQQKYSKAVGMLTEHVVR